MLARVVELEREPFPSCDLWGQSTLSISTSRDSFWTIFLRLMMYFTKPLAVFSSDSRAPILFSAALCILCRVGRSALSMAFCVRSGVLDSSLLSWSGSSSSSSSSFWSRSSSSSGASGASELDELEDELSYEEDSLACSFSFGVSFAGLFLRFPGFLRRRGWHWPLGCYFPCFYSGRFRSAVLFSFGGGASWLWPG